MYFCFFKLMNKDFEENHDEMVSRLWFIEDMSEEEVIGWRRSMLSAYIVAFVRMNQGKENWCR